MHRDALSIHSTAYVRTPALASTAEKRRLSCHVMSRVDLHRFFKIHNQVPFFGCKKKEKIDPAQVHTSHILLNVSKGKSRLSPPQTPDPIKFCT